MFGFEWDQAHILKLKVDCVSLLATFFSDYYFKDVINRFGYLLYRVLSLISGIGVEEW